MTEQRSDTERFKQDVIRLDARVSTLEKVVDDIRENRTLLHKIDIEVEGVQTQMKITWVLLMLLLSGIVGLAFSFWKGGFITP